MNSLRIWYVHPYAGGPGVGRYWRPFSFCKHWSERGHTAHVVTSSYHHLMEPDVTRVGSQIHDDVTYHHVRTIHYSGNGFGRMASMFVFSVMLFFWGLKRLLFGQRPDLIVYSSPHPFGFISAWLLARLARAKIFFEVRDIWPLSVVELAGMSDRHPFVLITGWIEQLAYTVSDKVISLLPLAEQHMSRRGLRSGKFAWIPNGIEHAAVDPAVPLSHPLLQQVNSLREAGKFVLVYAGAHGEPNGLLTLIDALDELRRRQCANVVVVLVGKGEIKAKLVQRAHELKLDSVIFYDQVPKPIVGQVLRRASAGYISLKPEPIFRFGVSPNKLWDYMLAELPVVFACRAGNDPVAEAACGVSVDPEHAVEIADAIQRLASLDEATLKTIGGRGRDYVLDGYEYEKLSSKVIELYADSL